MNQEDKELLLQVFSSVFEDFAFMFVEEATDWEPEKPGACLRAKIDFMGRDKKGSLQIVAPLDICTETAQNVLGTEPEELPSDAGENALKELANIACSCLLAEKFGVDETFDISIPETRSFPEKKWGKLFENPRYAAMLVDESPFLVTFDCKG